MPGFIVEGIDEAVDAVHNIGSLSRESVRKRFDGRFTIERAARDNVRVCELTRPAPAAAGGLAWSPSCAGPPLKERSNAIAARLTARQAKHGTTP